MLETPGSPETPRKTRARERHERRKERQQGMAQPTSSVPRHLAPTGSFKLPEIRLPENRIVVYGAGAVVFILAVILILGRLKNTSPETGSNAIWLGTQWTYDAPDDAAVSGLVQKLRDNRIGTVYAWVSLLQPSNAWTDTGKLNQVKAFVQQFKRLYPQAKIYGWLSIGSQGADGNNRLGDPSVQQMIADFSEAMITQNQFDGVALNVLPVTGGDENYLALLRKVRATIGEEGFMAVAVPPDWTPTDANITLPPQIAPNTIWDEAYKQRVALLADQLIVTAYNSGLSSPADYSTWVAYQVKAFANAIADLDATTDILIGVPTYDDQLTTHDPAVENVTSAVSGIRDGLSQAGVASQFIRGIAIYAEWQTTEDDWSKIKSLWAN